MNYSGILTYIKSLFLVLETQYSGDTILLIFPDGTGPALLTSLMGGIPLNRVHELEYAPGEIRLNIGYESARSHLNKEPSSDYTETLERGKESLKELRENGKEIMNVRDAQYAQELKLEEERKIRLEKEAEGEKLKLALEEEERNLKAKEREAAVKKERKENERENTVSSNQFATDSESTVLIGVATVGAVFVSSFLREDEPTLDDKNINLPPKDASCASIMAPTND